MAKRGCVAKRKLVQRATKGAKGQTGAGGAISWMGCVPRGGANPGVSEDVCASDELAS